MNANNEFTVSEWNENGEPIFKIMLGHFGEEKKSLSPTEI